MSEKDSILFVAADPAFREAAQEFLQAEGHAVICARSAPEALRAAAMGAPGIMVIRGDRRELADLLPNLVALCPHALVVTVEDPPRPGEEPNEAPSPWTLRLVREESGSGDRRVLYPTLSRLLAREKERRGLARENLELRVRSEDREKAAAEGRPAEPAGQPPGQPEGPEKLNLDFVSLLSRELRTPLSSIIGFAEIISNRLQDSQEDLEEMVEVILRSGLDLESFLNDALEFLHWTSGNMSLIKAEFDLVPHLQRVIRERSEAYREKRIRVLFRGLNALRMMGDARLLVSAIGRLLDNAFKFSSSSGVVEISLGEESRPPTEGGATMVLKIRDHGIGLHRHQIEQLFNPLEVRGDLLNHAGGHGLGLALARECLRAHGGRITLESEGPQKGCLVTVELTVAKFVPFEANKIPLREIQKIA